MVVTPWGEADSLRDRRLHPGPGTSAEEVAKNQRERLFAAMVATVAAKGYEPTRVADLVELSGVSSRSFYDLFGSKEACFAATLEELLGATIQALEHAEDPNASWEERLRQTYEAFAAIVVAQPASATICLSEAYAAGPAARAPVERAIEALERMTRSRLSESPERAGMPEEMIIAHVGALQEIARTRLREGKPGAIGALVPELVDLMLSYRPPPQPLRLATRSPSFGPESVAAHDDAERALRAFAVAVAEHGYAGVTIHEVARLGAMSPTTFYANFRDKQDAMLAAIDSGMAQLRTAAITTFQRSPGWAGGVRAAIGSMLNFLASRPAMAHLLAVEVYAAGPEALRRRGQAARPMASLLAQGFARSPETPPITAELVIGAIAGLVRRRLLEGGPDALPGLAPVCTYIALSPFLGPDQACIAANGDGRARLPTGSSWAAGAPTEQPTKWVVMSILALRSESAEALSTQLDLPVDEVTHFLEELETDGLAERIAALGADRPVEWISPKEYRLIDRDDWAALSQEERDRTTDRNVELISTDLERASAHRTIHDRLDTHLSRSAFTVDEEGWEEIGEIHRSALYATLAIQRTSLIRLRSSGERGINGRSIQALFAMPDTESEPES
jgi:AcrR family transcriptional regulator